MTLQLINEKKEGDILIREYSRDGVTVSNTIKEQIQDKTESGIEPQPSIEQQILAELQYNTALAEMKMLGGM